MCFVGVNQQPLSAEELIKLLERLSTPPSYYFLRWAHRVGGFWQRRSAEFSSLKEDVRDYLHKNPVNNFQPTQPEVFPSPEGQLFNSVFEVRWKQQKIWSNQDLKNSSQEPKVKYQVLLLSSQDKQSIFNSKDEQLIFQFQNEKICFQPIKGNWEILEQNVLLHARNETRFPKEFTSDKLNNLIAQRYFRDKDTATVHFVALRLKP